MSDSPVDTAEPTIPLIDSQPSPDAVPTANAADKVESKMPLTVEVWLDFIIASPAHRSLNTGHQKFGELLIQRYFVTVPDRYKEDPVATLYFDEMLCAVASAMRGFSALRDRFQGKIESLKSAKDAELKRIEQIDSFSPISKDGVWGKVVAIGAAGGLAVPIQSAIKSKITGGGFGWVLAGMAGLAVAVIALTLFVYWLRGKEAHDVEEKYPESILAAWEKRPFEGYRDVLRQFIPLAREISERHYPGTCPEELDAEQTNSMIERHFALKAQEQPIRAIS